MIVAQAGRPFTATVDQVPAGSELGVRVLDAEGATVVARTTEGVTQVVSGGDVWKVELTAPATPGDYLVAFDLGGTEPLDVAVEDLRVLIGLAPVPVVGEVFVDPADLLGRAVAYERLVAGRAFQATLRSQDLDGLELPATADVEVLDLGGRLLATAAVAEDGGNLVVPLPADATARPLVMVVVWHNDDVGFTATSVVDVVGSALFSLADARAGNRIPEDRASDDELRRARADAERDLEDACGVAFVRRYHRELVRVDPYGRARLLWGRGVVLRELEVDGQPQLVTDEVRVNPAGILEPLDLRYRTWWLGAGTELVVAYEHGYHVPPPRARVAALKLARWRLLGGPADERALAVPVEGGGSIPLATPGVRGRSFGIPDVDAFVADFRRLAPVLA